ncbi:hypothetical protein BH10BAC2_BH10BAC2_34480 [soil metagenome]
MFVKVLHHWNNHQYFYSMQQLDLFANFPEVLSAKPAEKNTAVAVAAKINPAPEKTFVAADEGPAIVIESMEIDNRKIVDNAPFTSNGSKRGRKSFKEMDADIVMVEVPDDDLLFQKQYYAISEVAKWFHVNQSLLRYWENEFSVLKPRKTRKGDRLFRPEDVKNLQLIYHLLRQRKFSIEGARQYLKDNKKKADAQMQLIQSLTKFRAFLLEWRANLEA